MLNWASNLKREDYWPFMVGLYAGGLPDKEEQITFGNEIVKQLRNLAGVHHLSLDSDRAYPKKDLASHEVAAGYDIPWESKEWKKGKSYHPKSTLYDEWTKFLLAIENRAGVEQVRLARTSLETGTSRPDYDSILAPIKNRLWKSYRMSNLLAQTRCRKSLSSTRLEWSYFLKS